MADKIKRGPRALTTWKEARALLLQCNSRRKKPCLRIANNEWKAYLREIVHRAIVSRAYDATSRSGTLRPPILEPRRKEAVDWENFSVDVAAGR